MQAVCMNHQYTSPPTHTERVHCASLSSFISDYSLTPRISQDVTVSYPNSHTVMQLSHSLQETHTHNSVKTYTLTSPSSAPHVSPWISNSIMLSRCWDAAVPDLLNLGSPCHSFVVLMVPMKPLRGGWEGSGGGGVTRPFKFLLRLQKGPQHPFPFTG